MRFVVLFFYAPHPFLSFALVAVALIVAVVVIAIVVCVLLACHTPRPAPTGSSISMQLVLGTFTPAPWHSTQKNYACKIYLMVVLPLVDVVVVAVLAKLCKIYAIFDTYLLALSRAIFVML